MDDSLKPDSLTIYPNAHALIQPQVGARAVVSASRSLQWRSFKLAMDKCDQRECACINAVIQTVRVLWRNFWIRIYVCNLYCSWVWSTTLIKCTAMSEAIDQNKRYKYIFWLSGSNINPWLILKTRYQNYITNIHIYIYIYSNRCWHHHIYFEQKHWRRQYLSPTSLAIATSNLMTVTIRIWDLYWSLRSLFMCFPSSIWWV